MASQGDPRGVLRAIAEYETLSVFGWAALYGEGTLVPASYVARTRLVMAARAQAEKQLAEEAQSGSGSSGGSGGSGRESGTYTRQGMAGEHITEHVAQGERPRQRASSLDRYGAG